MLTFSAMNIAFHKFMVQTRFLVYTMKITKDFQLMFSMSSVSWLVSILAAVSNI